MLKKSLLLIAFVLVLLFPLTARTAEIPARLYENGANNSPVALAGVRVEVFAGYGFKALLFSGETGSDGGISLDNVPLGKDVLVRLTKAGYISQYDVRSYSDSDAEEGVVLWIGSEANVKGLYASAGEDFDRGKGHVYLEVIDELTGEGIEGIRIGIPSGKAFDLGQGEYLIANAGGNSITVTFEKPGYAFDIESATLPLFPGGMTQSYLKVQAGGGVYSSMQASTVTASSISGFIKRASDAVPISAVFVGFRFPGGDTAAPTVVTNSQGFYIQYGFPVAKRVKVTPEAGGWTFKFKSKTVQVTKKGAKANFKGKP